MPENGVKWFYYMQCQHFLISIKNLHLGARLHVKLVTHILGSAWDDCSMILQVSFLLFVLITS